MLIITKENLPEYLKTHYPQFCTAPLTASIIGEDDDDQSGVINQLMRVRNGQGSIILKQGLDTVRTNAAYFVPPERNRHECESLQLRDALLPGQVPQVLYHDLENNLFLMEDVSYLRPARVLLTENKTIDNFGARVAHFAAVNAFYTSEFYLDPDTFRALAVHFSNSKMRQIMENWVFLRISPYTPTGLGDPEMSRIVDEDSYLQNQCHLLRHKFMGQAESLIHGDMHTSNLFVDDTRLKVLDMEYTFAGPICYDISYFINSIITQYCSACYRDFPSQGERIDFKRYILQTMADTYNTFTADFRALWDADAKDIYKPMVPFREELMSGWLPDVVGFSVVPTISTALANIGLIAEYAVIEDVALRHKAMNLCLFLACSLMRTRHKFSCFEEVLKAILQVEEIYNKHTK